MEIKKIKDNKFKRFQLINDNNMLVEILNFGGVITKILVPDNNNVYENVVLAYKNITDYIENPSSMGCIIGRTAGRIGNGNVTFNKTKFNFPINNNYNSLHGGIKGFNKKFWDSKTIENDNEVILSLNYLSKDGEEGYPGNLNVEVCYSLNNNNELKISYRAVSDKDTLVNLTNHSYFNLSGNSKRNVLNQELYINASHICELDKYLIPSGNLINVKNTPFDFNVMKPIGQDMAEENEQLNYGSGYDHPWVLRNNKDIAAKFYDSISGRVMDVITNQRAIVCYTMNFPDDLILENGNVANKSDAICFEAQGLPIGYDDCFLNETLIKANEEYNNETIFRFYIK